MLLSTGKKLGPRQLCGTILFHTNGNSWIFSQLVSFVIGGRSYDYSLGYTRQKIIQATVSHDWWEGLRRGILISCKPEPLTHVRVKDTCMHP